ncbi:MAG: CoA-binding protein [Deltaproteobacteria bacterium]|nr:MAG: CoA-binding protein [Deltaproteobacteria bacterium]
MDKFFNPSSVAVIGASNRRGGLQIIKNLTFGFDGHIYPVNPRHKNILEIPCFPSVEAIPVPVDLGVVLVPASMVPDVLVSCAEKGISRVMIQSAGFAEVGPAGKNIQDRCLAIARENGIRIWGPNGMGLVDIPRRYFFTFMSPRIYRDGIFEGPISLIVQSGMLSAGFLVDLLSRRNIGLRRICSIGNKADVDECDLLPCLLNDSNTHVVALYLESVPRGRLLLDILSQAGKPIVVLKGGRSKAGAQAAISHTASLADDSRLLSDLLEMSGVAFASDFHEMIDLAGALALTPPIPARCRIAIVSFSGAAGIVSCDLMDAHGLSLARLSRDTEESLGRLYPDWMPVANPVDFYPAMEIHWRESPVTQAISILLKDPNVDVILVHFVVGLGGEEPDLAALKQLADQEGKVIVFWLLGRRKAYREFYVKARRYGIQVYDEISRAVACLAAGARFQAYHVSTKNEIVPFAPRSGSDPLEIVRSFPEGGVLDEYDSKRILKNRGIPVVEERIVTTMREAVAAAQEMGFPVVLKGLLPGETHKTEQGLVRPGLARRKDLEKAVRDFKEKMGGRGRLLIQTWIDMDYELIAGFLRDAHLGPCIMFGLGGIFSELKPDIRFALAPASHAEALRLIGRIRANRLLNGFRGKTPLNIDLMARVLVNLSRLGAENPAIQQIDINPVGVTGGIPVAVDAAMVLQQERTSVF